MVYRNKGFTLVELIITVAVVAIVAGIAVPSFTEQIRNNRSISIANEFVDVIGFARAQSVSRPARISICASNNGTACAGDWADGYIVFVDEAVSDAAAAPEVGEILKWSQESDGEVEMVAAYGGTATNFIRFTSIGTLARMSPNPLTINTKITKCKGNYARAITITLAGQTTVLPQDCNITF